ncbi:MAG TPA: NifU family protein [Planctomycetota bacterium]|nr:NifU family protein [Planctomycetota bacterium]
MSLFTRLFGRAAADRPRVDRGDPARVLEVDRLLDELRGTFAADGGDVRLAWIRGGVVGLELHGACAGCAASGLTLELLLRPKLRERCAWFETIERV